MQVTMLPGTRVVGGSGWQEGAREGGATERRPLSKEEFLNQVLKEVFSWLRGVIDFRVFAIMNSQKSDTAVLKT